MENYTIDGTDFDYGEYLVDMEPFVGYIVQAKPPGPGFYGFVATYTIMAFLLIAPLVKWSLTQQEKKQSLELKGKHLESEIIQQQQQQQQQFTSPLDKESAPTDHRNTSIQSSSRSQSGDSSMKYTQQQRGTSSSSRRNQSSIDNQHHHQQHHHHPPMSAAESLGTTKNKDHQPQKPNKQPISSKRPSSVSSHSALHSIILRELDQSYPDLDPDFQSRVSTGGRGEYRQAQTQQQQQLQQQDHQQPPNSLLGNGSAGSKAPTEASSGTPSAATTTQLHVAAKATTTPSQRFGKLVLDVGGRRWKNRRPIGRVDVIQNAVTNELIAATNSSSVVGGSVRGGGGASGGTKREGSITSGPQRLTLVRGGQRHSIYSPHNHSKGMSDVASSILSEQHHELHKQPQVQVDMTTVRLHQMHQHFHSQQELVQQQQHPMLIHRLAAIQRQRYQRSQRSVGSRARSKSIASEPSILSSIVDDISPQDAADANDPGQGNIFVDPDVRYLMKYSQQKQDKGGFGIHAGCLTGPIEALLSLAAPDDEKLRVLKSSLPLALGASSESFLRLGTAAFISQYLGTESMAAFLLVGLFVRLTSEELSGAIVDSLSAFVHASIHSSPVGDNNADRPSGKPDTFLAGQFIQLAVILQLLLNAPLLTVWAFFMGDIVMWFVSSMEISTIAQDYASIVVFAYMMQALSRTLTVTFHICGHEHFESIIDVIASALQFMTIACVVAMADNVSLTTVGYIQLLITIAAAVVKITFAVVRGWMQPFRKGLIQNFALVNNRIGIWHLLRATGPLLLGTILEYGEWELLTIFVQHLGSAEVVTWALMGALWDVLEAWTEGIGEASATQVAFLLSVGQTDHAKNLSYSVIYMAVTQAMVITSVLFMSGQYLAIIVTSDPTIQHLINDSIAMIGIANVIMAFAQITWSLVGAQGRFRLGTAVIFFSRWLVTIPCALICIYAFFLDLNAVSGSLVIGYSTASCALTFIVIRSDWDRLARLMEEMNLPFALAHTAAAQQQGSSGYLGQYHSGVDPILGLVNLDDFDDSSDDSEGIGFGTSNDDNNTNDYEEARTRRGVDEKSTSARSRVSGVSKQQQQQPQHPSR